MQETRAPSLTSRLQWLPPQSRWIALWALITPPSHPADGVIPPTSPKGYPFMLARRSLLQVLALAILLALTACGGSSSVVIFFFTATATTHIYTLYTSAD